MRYMSLVVLVGSLIAITASPADAWHRRWRRNRCCAPVYSQSWGHDACCGNGYNVSYSGGYANSYAYDQTYSAPAYTTAYQAPTQTYATPVQQAGYVAASQNCQPSYGPMTPQPYGAGYGPRQAGDSSAAPPSPPPAPATPPAEGEPASDSDAPPQQ